jgi:hypothetical protein
MAQDAPTPARRGRKPTNDEPASEPLDFTQPVYVLIDRTPAGTRTYKTFTDKAACDAEASRITLSTGRHVARFGPQYGVTAPVAQAAEMPLAFD